MSEELQEIFDDRCDRLIELKIQAKKIKEEIDILTDDFKQEFEAGVAIMGSERGFTLRPSIKREYQQDAINLLPEPAARSLVKLSDTAITKLKKQKLLDSKTAALIEEAAIETVTLTLVDYVRPSDKERTDVLKNLTGD